MKREPGKYDALATSVRERTNAVGVVMIVLAGDQGHGFSVQTLDPSLEQSLPTLLRYIADNIERDLRASGVSN
jgi:hypothetical protein